MSSKIEGTQVYLSADFEFESGKQGINIEHQNDRKVINYRRTLYKAKQLFKDRPFIHINMLKELHSVLLNCVRGRNKGIGNFRSIQVYIGKFYN